jgi:hypothetical protein
MNDLQHPPHDNAHQADPRNVAAVLLLPPLHNNGEIQKGRERERRGGGGEGKIRVKKCDDNTILTILSIFQPNINNTVR